MRPDDLYDLLHQQPFQPFRIHLSNGKTYDVRHPDLAMVGESTMIIGTPAANRRRPTFSDYAVVALIHINHVEPLSSVSVPRGDGASQS
jgi:hypothetical protein